MKGCYFLILLSTLSGIICCSNPNKSMGEKKCFSDSLRSYNVGIGDADTSLVVHFWRDFPFDFDENIEDYTRLATEKEKIFNLMYDLFGACPSFLEHKVEIQNSQYEFRNYILKSLYEEGEQNGYLSDSRELYYLKITNDPACDTLESIYGKVR